MAAVIAWVLNLDADLELAAPHGYAPSPKAKAAMAPWVARLAKVLLAPGDVLVGNAGDACESASAAGLPGRAFCPTPHAIALLRRAGAEPEAHPPLDVLRAVNSRAFSAPGGLPGAVFARTLDEAVHTLRAPPQLARQWRAKRAFGMAGRGQRPIAPGVPSAADLAFLRAGIEKEGGIQIEPEVAIERELVLHGLLAGGGALRLGALAEQTCDGHGQWLATTPLGDAPLPCDARAAITAEAHLVAASLHRAGYFGPFGLDAFLYRDREDALRLQPRSEINARYSMGWAMSRLDSRLVM